MPSLLYCIAKFNTHVLDFTLIADDTTIRFSHKNIASHIDLINDELDKVNNWFKVKTLSANASKTIDFNQSKSKFKYPFGRYMFGKS